MQTNTTKVMAHLVAGYPEMEMSFDIARALVEGGADYLEVQFPFSDPSADGPVIERACHAALAKGFRVDEGFELIKRMSGELSVPVFVMTYGSVVVARGADEFCRRVAEAGGRGVVVPDLPPDYSEGLFKADHYIQRYAEPELQEYGGGDPYFEQNMHQVRNDIADTIVRTGNPRQQTPVGVDDRGWLTNGHNY